ncbi:MAG: patatin-like phospholipase family protein [Thermoguttaceae bacterium]|jgi:NTE family protein
MPTPLTHSREAVIREKYLPPHRQQRTALSLSGGGYRAALFHLGVCRRLNELGVLANLDAISAVSGGSIFAAHLARCLVDSKGQCLANYEELVAIPFRAFVQHDIRTVPALTRLLPCNWFNSGAGAESLAGQYEKYLLGTMTLSQLPPQPNFIFCATDLTFGVAWVFSKQHAGDYQAGYMSPVNVAVQPLARAVAASSCFPPVFRPLPMNLQPPDLTGGHAKADDRDECVRGLALTDGGVYDNMGLEPVWKTHKSLLVSDGGKPFQFAEQHDTPHQLLRMQDIMANQAEALRKRWLISGYLRGDYTGAYLGIRNAVSDYPISSGVGYSKEFATQVIAAIRTDMDRFSDDEIWVLENHGYTLADAAYRSHVSAPGKAVPPLQKIDNRCWPDPQRPLAELEKALREALANSSTIYALGH